jgi:medium-chain acyl-[acyl-carrier-protein] hydrolase
VAATSLRLFCLPYAGGSAAAIYGRWSRQLDARTEVIPVELAGRGARIAETPVPSAAVMVNDALRAVLPCSQEPFALFGHSLGAVLAFEMARRLEHEYGRPPAHLFVSGFGAPDEPATPDLAYLLPEHEFRDRLRDLSGTPREVLDNDDLMELVLPVLRADFAAIAQWRFSPGPPLSCPVTVFGGLADPEVEVATLAGWQRQTTASCEVRLLPGQHFYINESPDLLLPTVTSRLHSTWPAASHERSR